MSFLDFVAIKLTHTSKSSVTYKSISSFLSSIKEYGGMQVEDQLNIWAATMIGKGFTTSSRKRYVEKLSAIYNEYCTEGSVPGNPFAAARALCSMDVPPGLKDLGATLEAIERNFDVIMCDAVSIPELAVFLYLLFNASADIEKAISLKLDDYEPEYPQLDDIIRVDACHHRRKYVFNLNQSRKRVPQLVSEVTKAIDLYFYRKNIRLSGPFSAMAVKALWMAKAQKCGVRLVELKQIAGVIPKEYAYLQNVKGSDLALAEINDIKHRVAEAFAPSGKRWYAIRLRKGVPYDDLANGIHSGFSRLFDDNSLFYPQKEIIHRVEKKIVSHYTPVIPNIAFLYTNPRHIKNIDSQLRFEKLGYIFKNTSSPDGTYSVIDTHSMARFQYMIGIFTPDIKMEVTDKAPVGIGREVVITGGIMAGYEGTIYDIKDSSDMRSIYVRLSDKYSIRAEVKVEEIYVKSL